MKCPRIGNLDVPVAYKLLRRRKDGSLGPLFIHARQRIPLGKWLRAEDHPTKGYARRPGWHAAPQPKAPHLSTRGRVWCVVELRYAKPIPRPENQGGYWWIGTWMRVTEILEA